MVSGVIIYLEGAEQKNFPKQIPSTNTSRLLCAKMMYDNFTWPQDLLLRTTSPRLMDDSCCWRHAELQQHRPDGLLRSAHRVRTLLVVVLVLSSTVYQSHVWIGRGREY
jgi:hypothetical protein